jgi:hypothetical protein
MCVAERVDRVQTVDDDRRLPSPDQPEQLAEPAGSVVAEDRHGALVSLDSDDQLPPLSCQRERLSRRRAVNRREDGRAEGHVDRRRGPGGGEGARHGHRSQESASSRHPEILCAYLEIGRFKTGRTNFASPIETREALGTEIG